MPDGERPRVAVVGATGAVGPVTIRLLRDRGHRNIRAFASSRSAGSTVEGITVEEATPEALGAGDLDLCFFSIGTSASADLVPHAVAGGAVCIDKSSAFRLVDGIPLVVPEVNGERAREHEGIVANPNCSSIPLTMVLAPLHEAAGLRRVRAATYQAASGAGIESMNRLRAESSEEHDLRMDWPFEEDELEEEAKIRDESRKILELSELPVMATCVRVPILVGHAEAVWVETEDALAPDDAERVLAEASGLRLEAFPTPGKAAQTEDVLVGRIRRDPTVEHGLALFLACDNLVKGAALNAVQIAELALGDRAVVT